MKRRVRIAFEVLSITILFILFGLSSGLFFYQKAYAGKIFRNVYLEDTNLSGLTKKQATAVIDKKFLNFANQEITITTAEKEITTSIKETGLAIDSSEIVKSAYAVGRDRSFIKQLYRSGKTFYTKDTLTLAPKIDQKKYDDFQKVMIAQLNISPQNADLAIEKGSLKETGGSVGQLVDISNLPDLIMALLRSTDKVIRLEAREAQPSISNANFSSAKVQAESILSKNIVFSYNDKTFTPNRTEIGYWIKFVNQNNEITASLNDDNIKAYLNKIAKDIEVQKRDKKVNANDGSVIDEGQAGLYIDKNNAISQIKNQIKSSDQIKVALSTYTEAPNEVKVLPAEGTQVGRFEGKYIDVDLTAQKLCRIESTNLLACYTVSSGKASMPTPTGTFHITAKNDKQWSNKYGLWMPWWQQFNGDYGLHELPEWPNGYKEGEAHLGTPVSHGCVRLGIGSAKEVYYWTEIGTPVYIHK